MDEDGEPSDDSSDDRSRSSLRERAGSGASTGDGGGPMRGCPPRRAPVGSQGVLSLDILGLTGWNALCLVPNSTTLVGCVLLLRWSSDAMFAIRGILATFAALRAIVHHLNKILLGLRHASVALSTCRVVGVYWVGLVSGLPRVLLAAVRH